MGGQPGMSATCQGRSWGTAGLGGIHQQPTSVLRVSTLVPWALSTRPLQAEPPVRGPVPCPLQPGCHPLAPGTALPGDALSGGGAGVCAHHAEGVHGERVLRPHLTGTLGGAGAAVGW